MKRPVWILRLAAVTATALSLSTGASAQPDPGDRVSTRTPIKHLVVIFQENVSFDHYFGTYPSAKNTPGEPRFVAKDDTPSVNGLSEALLTANPNLSNPQRLERSEALTCDQDHDYTPEQSATNHGAMDKFVQNTSDTSGGKPLTRGQCDIPTRTTSATDFAVMDYYDGNTVTGLWNYAQHFAMSDNSFGTTYGPSTPGALNLIAGNTFPALCAADTSEPAGEDPSVYDGAGNVKPCPGGISTKAPANTSPGSGTGTVVGDPDPYYDACSSADNTDAQGGKNIGDALSAQGITWGWFEGGFSSPTYVPGKPSTFDPATICKGAHYDIGAGDSLDGQPCVTHTPAQAVDAFCQVDYSPHHQPFQYFASTSNPSHMPPSSVDMIGSSDHANHQYDLADFWAAVDHGQLPAVSFLKAARFQDGHAHNSDPLDEQHFLIDTINRLEQRPEWRSTAVVINWDDSDGWYDHVLAPVYSQSQTPLDSLTAAGQCGATAADVPASQQARCGLGPRLPLLVISPYARQNFVDHTVTDQTSMIRFVEDNWSVNRIGSGSADALAGSLNPMFDFGRGAHTGRLFLNSRTGEVDRSEP
jgi:phospholipase C